MSDREFDNINGIKVCDQTARNSIPTKTSQLENDSDFATNSNVDEKIANAQLGGGELDLSGYVTKETGNASQITFADGQTFQSKLDEGLLKGPKGDKGDQGLQGIQGPKGDKGDTGARGQDGLTTNIVVNGNTYTHSNGTITLPDYPTVPTKTSQLTNDSNYVTTTEMTDAINNASLGGATGGASNINNEVIQARGNFDTLYDRLDTTDKYIDVFHKNINNEISFTVENGGMSSSGGNFDTDDTKQFRARSIEMNYAEGSTKIIRLNNEYSFFVFTYDKGTWDKNDRGWLNVDSYTVPPNKYFRLHFKKVDGSAITDLDALSRAFKIIHEGASTDKLNYLDNRLFTKMMLGTNDFEIGGMSGGNNVEITNRIRTKKRIQLNHNDIIVFTKNPAQYYYGVNVYDENGNYNGVDYGWKNNREFIMPQDGYVRFVLRYENNMPITNNNINELASNSFIIKKSNFVAEEHVATTESTDTTTKCEAINSILVEYGRTQGASYVFVRIPKTLNNGKIITPRVRLTSADGSISGTKRSTLNYARDNDSIFTVNAGLFNISTVEPVGQLIIDGVSLINTPMTDDNGVTISDKECYPLAIDANGKFTTYPRNVDTSTMLNDGIQYAVTSWGKLVDNFQICTEDIQNEIVHQGKYIRQSIGQYQNGDYCVCTVDMTRGNVQNEAGLSYEELAQIFVDKGVKFAYSLDGGGSAETVLGKRQLNPIYEGHSGRAVPTVIEFCII